MVATDNRPQATEDPYDSAMNAVYTPPARTSFGEMGVEIEFHVMEKGLPLWDAAIHTVEQRRQLVILTLYPVAGSRFTEPIIKRLFTHTSAWVKITLASLKTLNADLRGLKGKWVQAELVVTGRQYPLPPDPESGLPRMADERTFKFVKIFTSESECQAAADVLFKRNDGGQPTTSPQVAPSDVERQNVAKFLPLFWKRSNQDVTKFLELIAADANLSKFFDASSPEVLQVIDPLPFQP